MITLRELREKLKEQSVDEVAGELGVEASWVRAIVETDAFEYLECYFKDKE